MFYQQGVVVLELQDAYKLLDNFIGGTAAAKIFGIGMYLSNAVTLSILEV